MGYIVAISSYFFMAIANVIDKFLISGEDLKPKKYVFLVGILSSLFLLIIPFGFFSGVTLNGFIWGVLAGITRMLALWILYVLIQDGDVSKVHTTMGGLTPLFSLLLTFVFFEAKLSLIFFLAFFLLIVGSLISSFDKKGKISKKQILMATFSSFLFSISFIFTKKAFLAADFWSSMISLVIGMIIFSLILFLFSGDLRKDILTKKVIKKSNVKKVGILFIAGMIIGSGASILQNLAIDLVPSENISLINALEGSRFAFVLMISFFLSFKFSKIFNRENLFQKLISIIIILLGMYFVFKI